MYGSTSYGSSVYGGVGGGRKKILCTENLFLNDSKINQIAKSFGEVVTLVVTATHQKISNQLVNEVVGIIEIFTVNLIARILEEFIVVADSIYNKTLLVFGEVITLSETYIKKWIKIWVETITLVDTFTRILPVRVFSEVITLVETTYKEVLLTFAEVVTLVVTATNTVGKLILEVVSLSIKMKNYLNGITAGLWRKSTKKSTTWTKTPKPD